MRKESLRQYFAKDTEKFSVYHEDESIVKTSRLVGTVIDRVMAARERQ
jgi:hypothetical protein